MRIALKDVTIDGRFRVLWSCSKIRLSEVEYVATTNGAKAALEIMTVLDFLQIHASARTIGMCEDNERAKALAENPQVLMAGNKLTCAFILC